MSNIYYLWELIDFIHLTFLITALPGQDGKCSTPK